MNVRKQLQAGHPSCAYYVNLQGNHFENGAAPIPSAEKKEAVIERLEKDNAVMGAYRQRAQTKEPLLVALFWIVFLCFFLAFH